MRIDGLVKILGGAFLIAILLYIASFWWIQRQREHKGPWLVTFSSDAAGRPQLVITQPHLKIEPHTITFPEQHTTNTVSETVRFAGPVKSVPFGELVFQDPTFLPGTVTFNFWNHEVELMPRTLIINKKEIPWHSQTNIVVTGEGKFERRPVKKRYIL